MREELHSCIWDGLMDCLQPGDTVVDVGFGRREYLGEIREQVPFGRVLAFEERLGRELDQWLRNEPVDVLRISIPGQEESALRGAALLLKNHHRRPRLVCVELAQTEAVEPVTEWLATKGYRLERAAFGTAVLIFSPG